MWGGLVSREKIDEVLDDGFEFVQMGRALLNEPGFVNRLRNEEKARCNCGRLAITALPECTRLTWHATNIWKRNYPLVWNVK